MLRKKTTEADTRSTKCVHHGEYGTAERVPGSSRERTQRKGKNTNDRHEEDEKETLPKTGKIPRKTRWPVFIKRARPPRAVPGRVTSRRGANELVEKKSSRQRKESWSPGVKREKPERKNVLLRPFRNAASS